jgi:hypothetical protein
VVARASNDATLLVSARATVGLAGLAGPRWRDVDFPDAID